MTKAGVTENQKINGCLSVDKVGCLSVLNDDMKIAPSIPLLLAQQLSNLLIVMKNSDYQSAACSRVA